MPLHIPQAPAAAERSVLTALLPAKAPDSPPAGRGPLHPAPLATLKPVLPLPVYQLAPIAGPGEEPRAALTGWRFLLAKDGLPVGAAEATLTADGWAFSHFCAGPFVPSTERAMRLADALPRPYQPRLLSVPQLYMLTLWLHTDHQAAADSGSPEPDDLLVPLAPAPPGIAAERPARTEALLPLLTSRVPTLDLAS
ncbi:hypothetical protein [Streptomyces hoynatensis]|uniref:Uncharacterized protein n=1 Tax=Streptomyces hoynatensis TaxID=1141874 RepID=A0A3A9ZAI3_9ACTN|nr:hypothetical protein [Streptomyces hoynatensis]RKN44814.1 hypothetical protein D7294_06740 [Streptomyces hoynatensis]